jgi:peptide/nickel transport system substrate-binding protein
VRSRRVLAGLLVFLLALAACRPGGGEQTSTGRETGARGGRLVVSDRSAPRTFNYLLANDRVTLSLAFFLLTARLTEVDHDTQQIVPGLAESWQVGDSGRTVTVKLREGLKFSDGAPLTSDDVLFTLKVIYDERINSVFRDAMLVGNEPMKATKLDDRTLRLDLPRPMAAPETNLNNLGVLPRHKLEAAYARGEYDKMWTTSAAPADFAVSGPFTFKEYSPGQRTILARNAHYWKKDAAGNQLPYLDELVIEVVGDPNTALLRFQQGELDVLDDIRPADYATLKDKPGPVAVRDLGPGLLTDFLWFNLNDGVDAQGKPLVDPAKRAWFTDVRFRRAVAHAIDRRAIIQNVLRGLGTPVKSVVSPSNKRWVSDEVPAYAYDLKRAKELLTEAGFASRVSGETAQLVDRQGRAVEFTLVVAETVAVRKQMATIIQEDLAKLGIKVQVSAIEDKAFVPLISQTLNYEAAIHGYTPTDTDPSSLAGGLKIGGQLHYWFMNQKQPLGEWEARMDQLMDEQEAETDATRRKEKFAEAQRLFAEHLPMIPLVVRHFVSGAKTNLGNYRPSFLPPRSLWNVDELFWKKG